MASGNGNLPLGTRPNGFQSPTPSSIHSAQGAPAAPKPLRPMNPAERFDDEKRRIQHTCFKGTDDNGQPLQSYITHVRVTEDAANPASPPPPDASPEYKKSRVIIIAVKLTGRVWLHKARENDDGSFQIGKSWPMDDLSAIESFARASPRTPQEQERVQWGGPAGMVVTMNKPYYWLANSPKEKEFFIGSLVKVFKKYTNGRVPELIGFDQREVDALTQNLSQSTQRPPNQRPPPDGGSLQPPDRRVLQDRRAESPNSGVSSPAAMSPPPPLRQQMSPSPVDRPHGGPRQASDTGPPSTTHTGRSTPQLRPRPSNESGGLRHPPSREQMRPPPPIGQRDFTPSPRLTPKTSFPSIAERPPDQYLPPQHQPTPIRPEQDSFFRGRSGTRDLPGTATRSSDHLPLSSSTTNRWRPTEGTVPQVATDGAAETSMANGQNTGLAPGRKTSETSSVNGVTQQPPERRRPPLQEVQSAHSETSAKQNALPQMDPPRAPFAREERRASPSPGRVPGAFDSPKSLTSTTSKVDEPPPLQMSREASSKGRQPSDDRGSQQAVEPPISESRQSNESESVPDDQKFRPGLGPMMGKKGDLANKFRKAATAYSAFKPRAGGAGERLLAQKDKPSNEPDGVTGVIPARSAQRELKKPVEPSTPVKPSTPVGASSDKEILGEKPPGLAVQDTQARPASPMPAVEPEKSIPLSVSETQPVRNEKQTDVSEPDLEARRRSKQARSPERAPRKPRTDYFTKAVLNLDIDPNLLEGRDTDYEAILTDFGHLQNFSRPATVENLDTDLRREISRLEIGSWIGDSDQKDDRVDNLENMLDKVIAECDELEGLLTLYGVELSTLNEDVAYIEQQSQGLQVQTANQKLLFTELQGLIETVSVDTTQLEPLRRASLADPAGIFEIEQSLVLLYRAMRTVDPALLNRGGHTNQTFGHGPGQLMNMRALQDRKGFYLSEASTFLHRLRQFIDPQFGSAFMRTTDAIRRSSSSAKGTANLDVGLHDIARKALWQYGPLMLFAKELDRNAWNAILQSYCGRARPVYQDEFRDNVLSWKKTTRKPTSEEPEHLFTNQEKESEGISTTARKLTVKRSQTLARGLRSHSSASGQKRAALDKSQDSKLEPCDAFAGALDEMCPLITTEQNFIIDFFHATTLEITDFVEAATVARPEERSGTDLYLPRHAESDRHTSKRVFEAVEDVFSFWPSDMQGFIDWVTASDPFQGVGILAAIERKRHEAEEANQEYLVRIFQKFDEKLSATFTRFVDDQIRAIEETKVKIKKRKGVIAFIKVFPQFSAAVEDRLPSFFEGKERSAIRSRVDDAYNKINKAMFDSLKVIAKESPFAGGVAAGQAHSNILGQSSDPEDKEALNYHILLIENMYHYYTEVDERGDTVLGQWRGKAMMEMSEHQEHYVNAVVRRPLGKLLDFLESTETLLANAREPAASIPNSHPSHSRSVFKKVLGSYESKEVRRGIDSLKKRIEKHFGGESEEANVVNKLVIQISGECERRYMDILARTEKLAVEVYENSVQMDFDKTDIMQGFRR